MVPASPCEHDGVAATTDALLALLDLERIEDDLFRGPSPDTALQRVFGGQVLGQALVAAGRTVATDRLVHSLHGYFLRPGDARVPIVYVVEGIREGRSFSTRRVTARQHGRPIFHMSASFHLAEEGLEHQDVMPDVPDPEGLPHILDGVTIPPFAWSVPPERWAALDVRVVAPSPDREPPPHPHHPAVAAVWLKITERLPDDPLVHAAVLAYASDLTLLASALVPHGLRLDDPRLQPASLDHAMWFHRPFRADEWLLHDEVSPSASGTRGMGLGRVFSSDGRLVATTAQEGLVRFRPEQEQPQTRRSRPG
ncbi:MAG: acyl-CoA thioesterase [Actinomycetes bacterium]